MTDSSVAWLNRLIDKGRILFVEGMDLRSHEAGIEWQRRADQFKEEAKAGVKVRSPDDAARLETLSPYRRVGPPPGNPWWTPPADLFTVDSTSSSVRCEENNPLSYHLALIDRLEKIVSDWRVKLPRPARREPTVSLNSAKTQCRKWLIKELKAPRTKRKIDYQDEALNGGRFDGLSQRGFLGAWDEARKEKTTHGSWRKRGPVGSS